MLSFFCKAYIFNQTSLNKNIFFFKNLFYLKTKKFRRSKHCLIQVNTKRSFSSKPRLNRFTFLKYQRLGITSFKKK